FSSRRRHTRSKRDWSSDVCSSDLAAEFAGRARLDCALDLIVEVLHEVFTSLWTDVGVVVHRVADGEFVHFFDEFLGERVVDVLRSEERRVGKGCGYRGWLC